MTSANKANQSVYTDINSGIEQRESAPPAIHSPDLEQRLGAPLSASDVSSLLMSMVMDPSIRVTRKALSYAVSAGDLKVTNRHVVGEEEPRVFGSFLEALWYHEEVKDSNREPERTQEVQLLEGDKVHRFHGVEAADILSIVSPSSCGDLDGRNQTMQWDTHEQRLVLRLSVPTWVRQAVGGSTFGKNPDEWRRALFDGTLNATITRRGFPLAFRNRRFWCGLMSLHAYTSHLLRAEPEFERLRCVTRESIFAALTRGCWGNPVTAGWKRAIDGIMNLEVSGESHALRKVCGEPELSALYKLRKLYLKDDVDKLQGAVQALERFTQPPTPHDAFAELGLRRFQDTFSRFLRQASPETQARWRRGFVDHQGGAGIFATRADGGRASEAHLIVALHRLSMGVPSPLMGVFGDVTADDLDALVNQVRQQDEHLEEILAACVWFLGVTREWPKCMYAIFPEREPKMRTFLILDYAEQFVGRLTVQPLREFLRTEPFCMAAFNGQKNPGTTFDGAAKVAAANGDWQLYADASCATDGFTYETSRAILAPLENYVPRAAYLASRALLAPRLLSATTKRPRAGTIAGFRVRRALLRDTRAKPLASIVTLVRDPDPGAFQTRESWQPPVLMPERIPEVRLKRHLPVIAEALRLHRTILVKAETGSGKTVLFSTGLNCIVQLPSIAALMMLRASLAHFNTRCSVYYSLQQDEIRDWEPILTTSSYVPILASRFPKRVVVLDEAELPQEDPMLNLVSARTWPNSTVIMSATPDSLRLGAGVHRLDLHTPSPHAVQELEWTEAEMTDFLRHGAFEKALIVVHSEPFARKLALSLGGVAVTADVRASDVPIEDVCARARVLVSTNIVRSSVNLPGLTHVFDYGIKYVELDFADQGFQSLLVTRVNADEVKQLRGRVGRMADGMFIKVKHDIEFHPHVDLVCGRLPKIAALVSRGGSLSSLPREVCLNSLACEQITQGLCQHLIGVSQAGLLPLAVRAARAMPAHGKFCLLLSAIEGSGLLGRAAGLRSAVTLAETRAYEAVTRMRACTLDELPTLLQSTFDALSAVPAFRTQTSIMAKWLAQPDDDDALVWDPLDMSQPANAPPAFTNERQLSHASVQRYLSVFFWRGVARLQPGGDTYMGVFRDFTTRRASRDDPPLAILIGLGLRDGVVIYGLAVPLTEDDFATLDETMRALTVIVPVSEAATDLLEVPSLPRYATDALTKPMSPEDAELCSLSGLRYTRAQRERNGRSRFRGVISLRALDACNVAQPSDLPGILTQMLLSVDGACETTPVLSSKGMPMSWIVSFPVLNAVNLSAFYAAQALCLSREPDFLRNSANGFGDDLAACGSELFCRAILLCRESLGLETNKHATGFYHPSLRKDGEAALGVFCEVVYNVQTGDILRPAKPRALLAVASALAPSNYVTARHSYLPDVADVSRAIERELPVVFRHLPREDEPNLEAPFRSTYPRALLRSVFTRSVKAREGVLSESAARELLEQVEPYVLGVAPSTKGNPVRVLPTGRRVPLIIGLSSAMAFINAINASRGDLDQLRIKGIVTLDELLAPCTGKPFHSADQLAELGLPLEVIQARRSNWQGDSMA